MPERETKRRAQADKREGKSASTQAGEFVREEIHHIREGKHGARSAKQAIAIGLSKARRAGVKLPAPEGHDVGAHATEREGRPAAGPAKRKPSAARSRAMNVRSAAKAARPRRIARSPARRTRAPASAAHASARWPRRRRSRRRARAALGRGPQGGTDPRAPRCTLESPSSATSLNRAYARVRCAHADPPRSRRAPRGDPAAPARARGAPRAEAS